MSKDTNVRHIVKDYYTIKDDTLYYFDTPVPEANIDTVRPVKGFTSFVKDDENVFFRGNILEQADPQTFFPIKERSDYEYCGDASSVYYCTRQGCHSIKSVAPTSFKELKHKHFFSDGENIYCFGILLEGAEPTSFRQAEGDGIDYYTSNGNVWYIDSIKQNLCRKVEGVDVETFTMVSNLPLNNILAIDSKSVYCRGIKVGVRGSTHFGFGYMWGPEGVYWCNKRLSDPVLIESANWETFETVAIDCAKDDTNIFFDATPVPGGDAKSLEEIHRRLVKDKYRVYNMGYVFKEIDSDLFVNHGDGFWSEGRDVYRDDVLLKEADGTTFHRIEGKDENGMTWFQDSKHKWNLYGEMFSL